MAGRRSKRRGITQGGPRGQKMIDPNTAGNAAQGEPNRKQAKRLKARINDYTLMKASSQHASKPSARLDSGGYHCPGSMQ